MIPIWKDTPASFETLKNAVTVELSVDGEVIYKGKLVDQPGNLEVTTFVNRIAKDYLSAKIEFDRDNDVHRQERYVREFTISPATTAGVSAYKFYCDYGYEEGGVAEGALSVISRPMSKVVDPRQILFCTFADLTANTFNKVEIKERDTNAIILSSRAGKCQTFTLPLSKNLEGKTLDIYDDMAGEVLASYDVRSTCAKYCLYYLNAHGGYDHLLINGNAMRTDKFTRTEISKSVDNTTLAHSRQTIATEVTPTWKLYTDCLTDEQWKLTHHLLGSSHIFLHDLEADEITPVVITSSVAEYKSYRNQGNKKSYLTIDVEASVKRMRK
jgi:hypothetical protein